MIDNDKYSNSKHLDGLPWSWFVPGLEQYTIIQIFSNKIPQLISHPRRYLTSQQG
jgi:hypothetical protein